MRRRMLLAGLAATGLIRRARAAAWPERPINLILPFTAGGPNDNFGRLLASQLNHELGEPGVVVLNRPGAAGNLGLSEVAAAAPDGHTLGIATNAIAAHVVMTPRPIVTLESLAWIANLVSEPSAIVVRPGTFGSLAELLAAARQRGVSVAHAGIGTAHQLALATLERRAGVELVQIPFNGSSAAKAQIIGGHIDAGCFPMSDVLQMMRDGQGRGLGVTLAHRSGFAPELPTFTEQGFAVVSGTRRGVVAPAALPAPIQETLYRALEKVMQSAEMKRQLEIAQVEIDWMPGATMLARIREDIVQIRELGLTATR